jgi:acetyl esterase/lipase
MRLTILGVIVSLFASTLCFAQQARNYPPTFPAAKSEVYKSVGDVKLKLFIFEPRNHKPSEPRPAIVFFFGGGFVSGSPDQFHQHCRYFASRGIVAITADYRVKNRHDTTPADSVQDGKDAMRYVRTNAKRLGIKPDRITASGGSAGALIAACAGVIPNLDNSNSKLSDAQPKPTVSYTPNAMLLFNPAILGKTAIDRKNKDGSPSFPEQIMPFYHIRKNLPPSILFFGTGDKFLVGAKEFQEAAKAQENRCEVRTWDGVGHGFFNLGRNNNKEFVATLKAADQFLVSLGYLSKGEPSVDKFMGDLQSNAKRQQRRKAKDREVAKLLKQFDKNEDGVLTQAELPEALHRLVARLDSNKDGKVNKTELLKLPGRVGSRAGEIITGPARGERYADALKVGESAPDFTLASPTGKNKVTLSEFQGKKPVVLIFGSYT